MHDALKTQGQPIGGGGGGGRGLTIHVILQIMYKSKTTIATVVVLEVQ